MFCVGGPGRTYGRMRLGWTDLGLAGVRLSGLRPERKLHLNVFLNVKPYTVHTNSVCFYQTQARTTAGFNEPN